ncbi:MAG: fibronectin type III domain-containing protein [Steroidobacteraceae bacterium]
MGAQGGAQGSSAVTLSWQAPTTNTNGTPLTNLAGYTINYGTDPAELTQSVTLPSAAAMTYTVQGLEPGTWYFEIAAYTNNGLQSGPSNVVSTTVDCGGLGRRPGHVGPWATCRPSQSSELPDRAARD